MVLVSYSGREINAKLVYYGPGLSGKTTNLEAIYAAIPDSHRGKMVSMKTKTERTLFFDFLPIQLGELSGFKTRFLLYTVPGQVYYNATRKLVLKGVDAVVFVADSKRGKMDENLESLQNLEENLKEHGLDLDKIPWVIQYNKRDLPDVYTVDELERALNPRKVPSFEATAKTGEGVFESFKMISRMLLKHLSQQVGVKIVSQGDAAQAAQAAQPSVQQAPAAPVAPAPQAPLAHTFPSAAPVPARAAAETPPPEEATRDAAFPAGGPEPARATREKIAPEPAAIPLGRAPLDLPSAAEEPPAAGRGAEVEEPIGSCAEPQWRSPETQAHLEETAAPLKVERVGMRLRRWFSRPREADDRTFSLESPAEPPVEALPAPQEAPAEEPAQADPISIELVKGPPAEPLDSAIESFGEPPTPPPVAEKPERCREVPIVVDLEPEDLDRGVILKLRITVHHAAEQGTDDRSNRWMARAA